MYWHGSRTRFFLLAMAVMLVPIAAAPQQPLDAQFRTLALNWARTKGWPTPNVTATAVGQITAANRTQWVSQIVDNIAIVDLEGPPNAKPGAGKVLHLYRLADQPDFKQIRRERLDLYGRSPHTAPGKTVFRTHWSFPGLPAFETIGTADGNQPVYEPVLYLTAEIEPAMVAEHHSLITEDVQIPLVNGFFNKLLGGCADIRWRIAIQTDDKCHIVDPAPHIQELSCRPTCEDFSVACAKGEVAYTTKTCPNPPESPLDCIKYVTEMEYATSGVKVSANLGAGATVAGVKLDAGITISGDKAGEAGSKESIGQLCADGLCIVDGTVVKPNVAATPVGGALATAPITSTNGTATVNATGNPEKGKCFADAACQKLLATDVTPGQCVFEHDGEYWMGSDGRCRPIQH